MKQTHTPGPWTCHSGMVWKILDSGEEIPIARMDRETRGTHPCERDANARLIASAPDLLSALEDAVELQDAVEDNLPDGYGSSSATITWMDAARAVIAAARGDLS